jgi:hypothetical protein
MSRSRISNNAIHEVVFAAWSSIDTPSALAIAGAVQESLPRGSTHAFETLVLLDTNARI